MVEINRSEKGQAQAVVWEPARYDAWYERPLGQYCFALEIEALCEFLQPQAGQGLLEVGAATGRFALEVARRGARVVATDPNAALLAFGRRRKVPKAKQVAWVVAEGTRLPFPSEWFDAAFTVAALCFAQNQAAIVRELARVVRPGGLVVLGELNRLAPWQWWRRVKGLGRDSPYRQANFRSPGELLELLRHAGLEEVRYRTLLHWLPFGRAWLLRAAAHVQRLGQRLLPTCGAFVVASGRRART